MMILKNESIFTIAFLALLEISYINIYHKTRLVGYIT